MDLMAQFLGSDHATDVHRGRSTTNQNFRSDYEQRIKEERKRNEQDVRSSIVEISRMLGEKDSYVRAGAIYGLAPLMEFDEGAHHAVLGILVAYLHGKRSIDNPIACRPKRLGQPLEPDIQAAIYVIGHRKEFVNTELEPIVLRRLALVGGNFHGVDEDHMTNFEGVVFDESDLRAADFRYANLDGANFASANLDYAHLPWVGKKGDDSTDFFKLANWERDHMQAKFRHASLKGARFNGAYLRGATFADADVSDSSFDDADLTWVEFSDAVGHPVNAARIGEHAPFSRPHARVKLGGQDLKLAKGCPPSEMCDRYLMWQPGATSEGTSLLESTGKRNKDRQSTRKRAKETALGIEAQDTCPEG